MRNWPKTLSAASFKGSVFHVDDEAIPKSGREVAVHNYVKTNTHSTEDMGRVPRELRIAGYFASDTADADVRAFVELCSEPGPGPLVMPQLGSYQALCTSCHAAAKKDELGRIKVDLEFIEAGIAGQQIEATPLGDRQAQASQDQMPDAAEQSVSSVDPDAQADGPAPATVAADGTTKVDVYQQPDGTYLINTDGMSEQQAHDTRMYVAASILNSQ